MLEALSANPILWGVIIGLVIAIIRLGTRDAVEKGELIRKRRIEQEVEDEIKKNKAFFS